MSEPWDNWKWRRNPTTIEVLYELMDGNRMLAWIAERPSYCNRGHFKAIVECVPDLNHQDGWPNYYMDLDRAKAEVEDFLKWRLHEVRHVSQEPLEIE